MGDDQFSTLMKMASDIAGIKATLETMSDTNEVAIKAHESAKEAHRRINGVESTIKWLWGTAISIGALTVGIIGLILKGGK